MDKLVENFVDERLWVDPSQRMIARVLWGRKAQGMSDVDQKTLRDFVLFCFERRPVAWPTLYDEMCYVAGHKLFRGMGYEELRNAGLDFTLVGLHQMARLSQDLIARRQLVEAATS